MNRAAPRGVIPASAQRAGGDLVKPLAGTRIRLARIPAFAGMTCLGWCRTELVETTREVMR